MINQLRTVLLNISASNNPGANYPGEELVAPGFAQKTIPGALLTIYRLVFGFNPDRAMLNLRLREVLSVMHSSPDMPQFIFALDPRITYWPWKSTTLFDALSAGPAAANLPPTTKTLYVLGASGVVRTSTDRLYSSYKVEVLNATDVRVTWETDPNGESSVIANYTISGGISSIVPLQGSDMSFRFESGVGSSWRVTWLALPDKLLGVLNTELTENLTADLQDLLFGTEDVEPYITCRNIWDISDVPIYRTAAVALALGYRMNDLT